MSNHNKHTMLGLLTARMDPRTLARFASASRQTSNLASQRLARVAVLKRLIRRRRAIKQHLRNESGRRKRLPNSLFRAKRNAFEREQYYARHGRPNIGTRRKIGLLTQAAAHAYWKYFTTRQNANWNRFTRIYAKTGRPPVNRAGARALYL
jgi:hypothetical protein